MASHQPEETVQNIRRLIGAAATATLLAERGGTSFKLPRTKDGRGQATYHKLAALIGETAAQTLMQHFCGESLYLPNCKQSQNQARNRAICQEFDTLTAKTSANPTSSIAAVAVIARKHRLSGRWIWKILSSTTA